MNTITQISKSTRNAYGNFYSGGKINLSLCSELSDFAVIESFYRKAAKRKINENKIHHS